MLLSPISHNKLTTQEITLFTLLQLSVIIENCHCTDSFLMITRGHCSSIGAQNHQVRVFITLSSTVVNQLTYWIMVLLNRARMSPSTRQNLNRHLRECFEAIPGFIRAHAGKLFTHRSKFMLQISTYISSLFSWLQGSFPMPLSQTHSGRSRATFAPIVVSIGALELDLGVTWSRVTQHTNIAVGIKNCCQKNPHATYTVFFFFLSFFHL